MKGSQAAIVAIVFVIVAVATVFVLYRGGYGAGPGGRPAPAENQVNISEYAFDPSSITVSVGTTVTWKNLGDLAHTVTSTDVPALFDSGNLSQGQTWQYTFSTSGTHMYKCSNHPTTMAGTVIVE